MQINTISVKSRWAKEFHLYKVKQDNKIKIELKYKNFLKKKILTHRYNTFFLKI
jgi:hypothetical protein